MIPHPHVMIPHQLGIPVLLFALVALVVGCVGGGSEAALTDKEKNTLDRSLQSLMRVDTSVAEEGRVATTEEGKGIYAVFIHVRDREAFSEERIPINSWSGSIGTARLTIEQIRQAAQMEAAESIRLSSRAGLYE